MNKQHQYIDLLITHGNFTLNSGNEPVTCDNRVSISQDVVHRIMESGIVKELIAERSVVLRSDILLRMELLTEEDTRLVPGTVIITDQGRGHFMIEAETYDFGRISGNY
ncbi:DUF2590 family protein [Photorhabdus tasmaniensis]|uniref:DUF2590 domain-containing protein n=1 Tax=Photorhabdus tasmaniensis TaxID=1004159 RepID=A0ABX0GDP8_9GAMM|nr:DUF2590 family protein [Photorhabdus tasmaniensis]NHB87193.1 DUF2590 domain-containing protein [Photorhabdus tasmaniensis]